MATACEIAQISDIDSLVAEIVAGTNAVGFDLTGDRVVDVLDLDEWRVQAGQANLPSGNPYLPGDANLDGDVDDSDFGIWNANKFTSANAASAVPEPAGHTVCQVLSLLLALSWRRRRIFVS